MNYDLYEFSIERLINQLIVDGLCEARVTGSGNVSIMRSKNAEFPTRIVLLIIRFGERYMTMRE